MNTACGMYGSSQSAFMNQISDYANEVARPCVYGQDDIRKNPSTIQQPIISESFARHNIPVNFEYNENTSISYFSQRGQNQYT